MNYSLQKPGIRILEVGAYIGASTVCLASHSRRPVVSIECGGWYDHQNYASTDIVKDLSNNVARFGLSDRVRIVPSWCHYPETVAWAKHQLDHEAIGLLVLDADGAVERDLENFADLIAHDCLMIFDDYCAEGVKVPLVKAVVDKAVGEGRFETFGIYGWGTWAGRIKSR